MNLFWNQRSQKYIGQRFFFVLPEFYKPVLRLDKVLFLSNQSLCGQFPLNSNVFKFCLFSNEPSIILKQETALWMPLCTQGKEASQEVTSQDQAFDLLPFFFILSIAHYLHVLLFLNFSMVLLALHVRVQKSCHSLCSDVLWLDSWSINQF